MEKPRILSGDELVARGTTKIDASLPEVGLKDVIPNGSWLEQKQIQSALEARRNLIDVQRIEKWGTLSHAEWREELMMAEVTQKAGGYWQYLGHNVGKQLFLNPEEALYLMEVNCLQLKYNEVTVSLQQAYSLLLRSKISLLQYKVFASLSRLGYKVFRHEVYIPTEYEMKLNLISYTKTVDNIEDTTNEVNEKTEVNGKKSEEANEKTDVNEKENEEVNEKTDVREKNREELNEKTDVNENKSEEVNEKAEMNEKKHEEESNSEMEIDNNLNIITEPDFTDAQHNSKDTENECTGEFKMDIEVIDVDKENENVGRELGQYSICEDKVTETENITMEVNHKGTCLNNCGLTTMDIDCVKTPNSNTDVIKSAARKSKLQKLENRKLKPSNPKDIEKHFELVADLFQKQIVTLKVPEEKHIPHNVFLNNLSYVLNMETIRSKTKDVRSASADSRPYSASDEINGAHVRRVRDSIGNHSPRNNWNPPFANARFVGTFPQYRPFQFWRPRTHMNQTPYQLLFQHPFLPNMNFLPRFNFVPGPPPLIRQFYNSSNFNANENNRIMQDNNRKRRYDAVKKYHFETIKRLAGRLKQLFESGNTHMQNLQALQRVINTFNLRYRTRFRINEELDITDDTVIETIELDDDEETKKKKPRLETDNKYNENLINLKQLASKLKELDEKNEASSRHRRAFTNVLKRFNKSYNAELYLNNNYDILDKRYITLDSSSDSDCVIEETPKTPKGKKLRNPFNILKRLSEKQNSSIAIATTSIEARNERSKSIDERTKSMDETSNVEDNKYSELIVKTFDKKWLPNEDDFGRVEVTPRSHMYNNLMDGKKEEYLYEFIKNQPYDFENWLDIKLSFYKSLEESATVAQSEILDLETSVLNSIIRPEDCTDMASILKKLSIIKCCKAVAEGECSLKIDFDVYNRDVQNFRKSNRPKAHFRVICLNESTSFPSGKDIAALHAKYDDNVAILFAVVGVGSISYLQINPTDIPVYIPSNDLT